MGHLSCVLLESEKIRSSVIKSKVCNYCGLRYTKTFCYSICQSYSSISAVLLVS